LLWPVTRSTWIGVCADVSLFEARGKAATATNNATAHFSVCTTLVIDLPNRSSRLARILDYSAEIFERLFCVTGASPEILVTLAFWSTA
jgi:hypothetical protein